MKTALNPCPVCGFKSPMIKCIDSGVVSDSSKTLTRYKKFKLYCPSCGCSVRDQETGKFEIMVTYDYDPYVGAVSDDRNLKEAIDRWNSKRGRDEPCLKSTS